MGTRTETDSFGPIEVDADHYWGAQTQRSLEFFAIGSEKMPLPVVYALATIKKAAAMVNRDLGLLDYRRAREAGLHIGILVVILKHAAEVDILIRTIGPKPLVALPWGSRSTTRIRRPASAR